MHIFSSHAHIPTRQKRHDSGHEHAQTKLHTQTHLLCAGTKHDTVYLGSRPSDSPRNLSLLSKNLLAYKPRSAQDSRHQISIDYIVVFVQRGL